MKNFDSFAVLDTPEIRGIIFYPRPAYGVPKYDEKNLFFETEPGVRIGCRFYQAGRDRPTILFFHGNGEIVTDYDDIATLYNQKNINLLVTDYRGYGFSDGSPTIANLLTDAKNIFSRAKKWLKEKGFTKNLYVMGRSLGSISAIEVAKEYQNDLTGLIVESGSATNFRSLLTMHGLVSADHPIWKEGNNFFSKEKIRRINIPTLIIHAEQDGIIPVQEAKILYENSGANSKKLIVIPRADHNNLMYAALELYFKSISEFIESSIIQ